MNRSSHPLSHRRLNALITALITALMFMPGVAAYAAATPGEQDLTELALPQKHDLFEYQIEGRPDPFSPFISEQAASNTPRPDEIIDPQERLSGMQLFEPGQLTLVAIVSVNNRPLAMVEDFTGKGYLLEKGVKVGKRGVVKTIEARRIIIEEVALTRTGKKIRSEFVMQLKNEGEQ